MLEITDKAREMLDQFAEQAEDSDGISLKVEIIGRGPKGFQYDRHWELCSRIGMSPAPAEELEKIERPQRGGR